VTGYESHDLPVLLHTDPVDGMVWK
jgi:hypothetical protein